MLPSQRLSNHSSRGRPKRITVPVWACLGCEKVYDAPPWKRYGKAGEMACPGCHGKEFTVRRIRD